MPPTTTSTTAAPPVLLQRYYQNHGISAPWLVALIVAVALLAAIAGYTFGRLQSMS